MPKCLGALGRNRCELRVDVVVWGREHWREYVTKVFGRVHRLKFFFIDGSLRLCRPRWPRLLRWRSGSTGAPGRSQMIPLAIPIWDWSGNVMIWFIFASSSSSSFLTYNWYSRQAIDTCTGVVAVTRLFAETLCPHRLVRSWQLMLHHLRSKRYRPYRCVGQTCCCSSWLRGKVTRDFERTWKMSTWGHLIERPNQELDAIWHALCCPYGKHSRKENCSLSKGAKNSVHVTDHGGYFHFHQPAKSSQCFSATLIAVIKKGGLTFRSSLIPCAHCFTQHIKQRGMSTASYYRKNNWVQLFPATSFAPPFFT